MIRIKICGVRTRHDAELVVRQGADAIGLILGTKFTSEDEIAAIDARSIISSLPPFISSVMVTHLQNSLEIAGLCRDVRPTTIQLHNDLPCEEIVKLHRELPHVKLIKAIHVVDETAIGDAIRFSPYVNALLLDTRTRDRIGGTGITHDWSISRQIVLHSTVPIILAGGLTPANVRSAIAAVGPFGVDVNSGVDAASGAKDPQKVMEFIAHARGVDP